MIAWLESLPGKWGISTTAENHEWGWPAWKRVLFANVDPKNVYAVGLLTWLARTFLPLHLWLLYVPLVLLVAWAFVKYVEHPEKGFEYEDPRDALWALLFVKALIGGPWL